MNKSKDFYFSADNMKKADEIISRYPEGKQASAVLPLLDMAQRQSGNWLPEAAMEYVAKMLNMPVVKVHEVATFYSMFNLKPVGQHHIKMCRTTPCWLRGGDEIKQACCKKLGIEAGETTADGKFTITEVECLGACSNAPVVQINDDYHENLDPKSISDLIDDLSKDTKNAR
ncbi:MAG: NADH-quinone oxidoreductase subunit NuoE [Alphaproteobacteria bacterium]|nr:NADH-quinone oxidoreductase subunit NuoE [Alphaproteobacteria bacterium]